MIYEINFFLFCVALCNVLTYTCVYAKHYANVTTIQFGTLAMILPALAFIIKPIACSLADAHQLHRQFLIGSLCLFLFSYGALGVIPFFKSPDDHEHDSTAWLVIAVAMCIGYLSNACVYSMNDALASNYARKHNRKYSRMRIYGSAGWASGALLIMLIGEVSWLPFRVPGFIILVIFVSMDIILLILWPYPEDFEMFHDGTTVEERKLSIVGSNTKAFLALNKHHRGSISKDILDRIKTGRSKSVGYVPNKMEHPKIIISKHQNKPDTKVEKKQKEYSNFQCQMILLKMIATEHKSFLRNVLLFTIFGLIQAMIFNYQMDYFKESVAADANEFEFISTLSMIAQSIFGEILINLIASEMIAWFGTNANMSLSLISIGIRCFFYGNLIRYFGPVALLLSEALQGPSLGLYNILTVEIGSNYALMVADLIPKLKERGIVRDRVHEEELNGCLRATMIGIMTSSMEGLGNASGALIGGLISNSYGYSAMWNFCAGLGIASGFINISWDLSRKLMLTT